MAAVESKNSNENENKPRKKVKNVFTYMESTCNKSLILKLLLNSKLRVKINNKILLDNTNGPKSLLYKSIKENRRIKVWTRSHSYVRSICTGYLVAFDQFWNLVG